MADDQKFEQPHALYNRGYLNIYCQSGIHSARNGSNTFGHDSNTRRLRQLISLFSNSLAASIDGKRVRPFINFKKMMTRLSGSVPGANCMLCGIAGIPLRKPSVNADSCCSDQPVCLPYLRPFAYVAFPMPFKHVHFSVDPDSSYSR